MVDKKTNRERVKRHRVQLIESGYKQMKVFLPPATIEQFAVLRQHFEIKKKSQLISKIIDEQYRQISEEK
jgi:hypothetical protein